MKKKDLIFIAITVGVIGLFIFLSLIGRKPKPLPAGVHASMTRETPRETCLECHDPRKADVVAPMPDHHPKKGRWDDAANTPCYACHKYPDANSTATLFHQTRNREGKILWPSQQEK